VVGMALRYRATAALAKGITMGVFGLWVVGTVIWHATHGTLPSAFTMGTVGFAALAANTASFGLLWAYRAHDPVRHRLKLARTHVRPGSDAGFGVASLIGLRHGRPNETRTYAVP
jgi:Co/Zn/Cd efflux system component